MNAYQVQLTLDIVRLGTACALFLLILPRVLFPGLYAAARNESYSGYWGGIVLAGTLYVCLVHASVLLGIYDSMILLGIVLALAAVRVGLRLRGAALTRTYADLLRSIENSNWFVGVKRSDRQWKGAAGTARLWSVALVAILVAAAAVRLGPLWQTASPFSLTFYDVLQDIKSMQISEMYQRDGFEERGLEGLALALHAFSQVGEATVVRLLGALSALLLAYSIYQVTKGVTDNRAAALVASYLFGVGGISLLPFGIENQVEADPVLLATAFALPALFFGGYHLHQGGRYPLILSTAALLTSLLASLPVTAVVGVVYSALALSAWLLTPSAATRRRAACLMGLGAALEVVVWGGGWAMQQALQPTDPYSVSHFEVVANSIPPFEVQTPTVLIRTLVLLTAGLLGLAACFDRHRLRRAACLTCGIFSAFLYALLRSPEILDLLNLEAAVPAVLLTAMLSVSAGLLVAVISAAACALVQGRIAAVKNSAVSLSVACLAIGGSSWLAAPLPQFEEMAIEPSGYAHAFEAAQRTRTPYQWTVVGHLGMKVRVQNEGHYMGYEQFVSLYDPATYDHQGVGAIPTREVFVLVDKQPLQAVVREELGPPSADVMMQVQRWCQAYAALKGDVSVFYEDEAVRVYRIAQDGMSAAKRDPLGEGTRRAALPVE